MNLTAYRKALDRSLAELDHAKRKVVEERAALKSAKQSAEDLASAQAIVQEVAETVQSHAHRRIASVVTRCLETVFGEDAYEFRIDFEKKRGKTEARLLFCRDGLEIDPLTAAGGGVVDVAAFALRLVCLVLSKPPKRRLLVLDEPFRFLSRDHTPAVRQLLLSLAEEMKVQIILVTHNAALRAGKVVEIE